MANKIGEYLAIASGYYSKTEGIYKVALDQMNRASKKPKEERKTIESLLYEDIAASQSQITKFIEDTVRYRAEALEMAVGTEFNVESIAKTANFTRIVKELYRIQDSLYSRMRNLYYDSSLGNMSKAKPAASDPSATPAP
jgi:predicted AAA+ superfamily ATPase